jgi:hypothetical protein
MRLYLLDNYQALGEMRLFRKKWQRLENKGFWCTYGAPIRLA